MIIVLDVSAAMEINLKKAKTQVFNWGAVMIELLAFYEERIQPYL